MATRLKNMLAVSWAMPPMLFPRSIQVSRLLNAMAEYGWQTSVICSDPRESNNNDTSLSGLYQDGYKVIQVPLDPSNPQPGDGLMSQWFKPAIKVVRRQLQEQKYSILVTFGQPWVDHLIGLEAGKFARIPWVAHFSDPWVDSPYYAGVKKSDLKAWQKMEYNIMRQADLILFTNSQAADLVMGKYSKKWKQKVRVVPHAYDFRLAAPPQTVSRSDLPLRMVYTGDFYGPRSAQSLFEALCLLSKTIPLENAISVEIMGRIPDVQRELVHSLGLDRIVTIQPQVPYVQSLQALAQADVLLLIDAPSSIPSPFLPSKLVDYLMFKKPVLGLTSPRGASADLLRQLECPLASVDDVPAIAREIYEILNLRRSGNLNISSGYEQVASQFNSSRVAGLLDEILSGAMARDTRLN